MVLARMSLAVLVFAGCKKDTSTPDGAEVHDVNIAGTVGTDATWSGTINLIGPTTITPTTVITVAAGTTIVASPNAAITLAGHMVFEGTSAAHIVLKPTVAKGRWGGFSVTGGLSMHYADQTGGGIEIVGGSATILDSTLTHDNDGRDFLIMSGGSVDMEYSTLGPPAGMNDSIHCDLHFNPDTNMIKIVHSDLNGATVGTDFYGGTADFTFDNWFSNSTDVVTDPGASVVGDFSNSWFAGGAPLAAPGSSFTLANLSPTKLTDTGPRP